mgnify:CR=1 FL=1
METKEYFEKEMFFESLRLPLDDFSTSPSLLQGELHISHQASLLPEERGCNRPPVFGTTSLYGCRTIKGLRYVVRDGTAWGKVDRIIEVLVLW